MRGGQEIKGKKNRLLSYVPRLCLAGALLSALVATLSLWPVAETRHAKSVPPLVYETVDPYYETMDVASRIPLETPSDVETKRTELIDYIWNGDGLPTRQPDEVVLDEADAQYEDVSGLQQIDKLTVYTQPYGLESIVYLFHPESPNGRLMVYHQGHERDGFYKGKKTMEFFLERGYAVLALATPFKGLNEKPAVTLPDGAELELTEHEQLEFLQSPDNEPMKYFFEPVAVALNYALSEESYDAVAMTGVSGGGWMATFYPALDTRIESSYPVAGSLPEYMRTKAPNRADGEGDYEQDAINDPSGTYRLVNYLELYVLAATGEDRRGEDRSHLQILNQYDPCCFAGVNYRTYEPVVRDRVEQIGGRYATHLDSTHREHQISPAALDVMHDDLNERS